MPSAADYVSSKFVKLVLIGNSGAGKTGALLSLAQAGYRLRILDLDNGLAALINHAKAADPKLLSQIDYMSFRDQVKMTPAGPKVMNARALTKSLAALDKWEDDSDPSTWGENTVLVIDSLTMLSKYALQWSEFSNPAFKDRRLWYGPAQTVIEDTIANLTSDSFATNVIVISHIDMREQKDGTIKGFAMTVGEALGPKIPIYFNNLVLSEPTGTGANVKRTLKTLPTSVLDLKNAAPMKVAATYPIETGLAEIFKALKS